MLRVLTIALCLCSSAHAFAEDSTRGRLPDGRAFRTDNQGNEIVDYIAELEISNDALTRKIHGLESELEEKTRQLERAGKGTGVSQASLVERDLVGASQKSVQGDSRIVCPPDANRTVHEELSRTRIELERLKDAKDEEQRSAQERIRTLESALGSGSLKGGGTLLPSSGEGTKVHAMESRIRLLESELQQKRGELERLEAASSQNRELTNEIALLKSKNDELVAQLQTAQMNTASINERSAHEVARLQAKVQELEDRLRDRETEVHRVGSSGSPEQRISEPSVVRTVEANPPIQDVTATLAPARARAIQSLKGRLTTDLNNLRSLIAAREKLYTELTQREGRVTFSLARPVSSRGIGVQEITGRLKAVTSVLELSAISKDLLEIRTRVEDDIKLIKRMSKSR